ncbi:unnamed protein product [Amoebophrya sp. A25]|nr:unnamed protein product [Amoebophrya sp. A25]|eukprot:GSA25T00007986001.1
MIRKQHQISVSFLALLSRLTLFTLIFTSSENALSPISSASCAAKNGGPFQAVLAQRRKRRTTPTFTTTSTAAPEEPEHGEDEKYLRQAEEEKQETQEILQQQQKHEAKMRDVMRHQNLKKGIVQPPDPSSDHEDMPPPPPQPPADTDDVAPAPPPPPGYREPTPPPTPRVESPSSASSRTPPLSRSTSTASRPPPAPAPTPGGSSHLGERQLMQTRSQCEPFLGKVWLYGDIDHMDARSAEECCELCDLNESCAKWSFGFAGKLEGKCMLRSHGAWEGKNIDVISGHRSTPLMDSGAGRDGQEL